MKGKSIIRISKLDAAKRQLESALRLWFHSGDPVSVHTLAAASHQVLHDLGKGNGNGTILRGAAYVKAEHRKDYVRLVSRAENFFKHADQDPEKLLEFDPVVTEFLLFDAVHTYHALTTEIPPLMGTFKVWSLMHHPYFRDEKAKALIGSMHEDTLDNWAAMDRGEFLAAFLPMAQKAGTV